MTTDPVIHRVTRLDLTRREWQWPFAEQRRSDIDAYFAQVKVEKPAIFNGRVLMARNNVFADDCLKADYFETDFASFLAWRDWGWPDKSVFNGFGMGAVRSNDGAFVLGEMGGHTANAGKIYFAAGTPDLSDLRGDIVDIAGSVARETEEEIGLTPADYIAADHWDCVVTQSFFALMRILRVDSPGEILRRTIEATLASQDTPELSAIHLVRSVRDFTPAIPSYVQAFMAAQFALD